MIAKNFFAPEPASKLADTGLLFLRSGISLLMMGHGLQKLMGYLDGKRTFADPIGMGQEATLMMAIFVEMICSILLILGLFTRAILIPLLITMVVIVFVVHAPDEFKVKEPAFMYGLVYLALLFTGPGRYSVDQMLFGNTYRISTY
ncbi:DoxX family protein [Dyadobacter tibetensis]|uniref:DoxX family protein n=1 Tax=Dyadobacter tibetensis TaxID=1211851 RepID=UPI0004713708|nr:DoxX family protein [Dyadobacter tibetensis]